MALGSLLGIFSTKECGCINATGNIFGRRAEEGVATDFKHRAQWPRTEGGRSLWRIVIEMKTGCYLAILGTMAVLEYSSGKGKDGDLS